MNILHITATHLKPTGGIPVVLKQLTDAQNKIPGIRSAVLSLKEDVKNIGSDNFFFLQHRSFADFVSEYKPDVVVMHSFFCIEYIAVVRYLVKNNIAFFIEPHGSFGKNAMRKSKIKKKFANATIFRKQIRKSIGYVFLNHEEMNDSIYRTGNDIIIPNGVIPCEVNSQYKWDAEEIPSLYFLGRYDIYHKGLDILFDALDLLERREKRYKINLYGTGNEEQLRYVRERIRSYNKLSVTDFGMVCGEDKTRTLENNNICIMTSRYEGFPMTILESLLYGNPCIVTPGTNLADELSGNDIGWKAELSAESIADTIIRALCDYKSQGREYFTRCREYVTDNYSWDKIGKDSIEQYKKVLSR